MIYRPLYVDKIMAYVDTPFVKILTGVRRCGKLTILEIINRRLVNNYMRIVKYSYRYMLPATAVLVFGETGTCSVHSTQSAVG